jgi:hypothetical protein
LTLETADGPKVLAVVRNAVAIELDSKPTGLACRSADGRRGESEPWLEG